ncbi:Chorismate mutase 2 [Acorus calamus]|uniref:chorismate mutase n=1 Tax=Acorus calamus TaxID=4465 RepID=A0AAV9CRT6_ACOCL|nr:Chorismate mutase 2 [Acorus calamus]
MDSQNLRVGYFGNESQGRLLHSQDMDSQNLRRGFCCSHRGWTISGGIPVSPTGFTLGTVRDSLERQEDTIIFSLIERARFPLNRPAYVAGSAVSSSSLGEFVIRETEAVYAKSLSRRIHYGRFVAEVKYRDAPQDYEPAIRAKDRNALMKLLTSESVEEMVKRRVMKKAMVFGQNVTLGDDKDNRPRYKIDPLVVSRIYGEWVIPLTKIVEVEYLLRRLD